MHLLKTNINGHRFRVEVSTKFQKMLFVDKLKTITEEGNMETRQIAPFFHLPFLLQLIATFISEFENGHNLFSCGSVPTTLVHSGL